jgi:peptidoglycan/LPS O-acetylase OafA/YrhL
LRKDCRLAEKKPHIFFPNLDGWRFVAFLAVFLVHCFHADFDYQKQTTAYTLVRFHLFRNGDLGVYFFFVLSGFLITYLLLKERELSGTIHVKSFYIRRALRIWPLYFFCVVFGFVLFPMLKRLFGEVPNETANPWWYLFFLGNFDLIRNGLPDSSVLGVLWSVSIEEQFYLVWPLLLFLTPPRHYPKIFLAVIGGSVLYRVFFHGYPDRELNTFCVISDMAVGGLSAWLVINSKRFLSFIENLRRPVIALLYVILATLFFFRQHIFVGDFLVILERALTGSLFGLIILEQNFARHSFFKMKNFRRATKLGKYAYGLYCLHFIGLLIQIRIGKLFGFTSQWWILLFGPLMGLALTIGIALASYHLYEVRFLRLKDKFAFITKGTKP